jgi:hypothetical protein
MPVVKVFGKVEPPWYHITFDFEPEVKYRIDEADIDVKAKIQIHESDIVVTVDLNRWDTSVLGWILQYLFDWVSAEINLFSFSTGKVFDVHLDRAEDPGGTVHRLISTAPDLAALATVCKTTVSGENARVDMRDALPLIVGSPPLMIALHDLVSSVRYGNNSLTNCARAVEGLRKAMWGREEASPAEQKQAWEKLRNNLNISKPFLQAITAASRGPRHGSTSYIPSTVRQDVLRKSWQVMDRFLRYRTLGDRALDALHHPVL